MILILLVVSIIAPQVLPLHHGLSSRVGMWWRYGRHFVKAIVTSIWWRGGVSWTVVESLLLHRVYYSSKICLKRSTDVKMKLLPLSTKKNSWSTFWQQYMSLVLVLHHSVQCRLLCENLTNKYIHYIQYKIKGIWSSSTILVRRYVSQTVWSLLSPCCFGRAYTPK